MLVPAPWISASLLALAGLSSALAQSDPLIAKGIPALVSDGVYVWAFADSGTSYSGLDLFANPVEIKTYAATDKRSLPGVDGGIGRSHSALLRFHYASSDSAWVTGLLNLDRQDRRDADSLEFKRNKAKKAGAAAAPVVEGLTALALRHDTAYVAAGPAGLAAWSLMPEGQGLSDQKQLRFQALVARHDTLVSSLNCELGGKTCLVDSLDTFIESQGNPESILAMAIDSIAPDTAWLWMGTTRGLWKMRLGSKQVTQVPFPGVADSLAFKVGRIVIDSRLGRIWAFSTGRYAVSLDRGQSFHVPPDRPGLTHPSDLLGFNAFPEALISGDTTFVNFNLDKPGLVLFAGDSVLRNELAKGEPADPGDILLDASDSLSVLPGEGRFTQLVAVASGKQKIVVAGTTAKGLFYLPLGGGKTWKNITRQKDLKNELMEVITFPTLFTAARPDGHADYVHIGYRLKKDGKVTITLYNYAMEKVRVLVRNAPRKGGGSRSEVSLEDRWDGLDGSGRLVSVGTYYVRVESSSGEGGWGKILAVAGRQ